MKPDFLEPFTSFGFWKLFMQVESQPFLLNFLNTLLTLESPIVELRLLESEDLEPRTVLANTAYHILCLDQAGQAFLVALQKEKLDFFKSSESFTSRFSIWEKINDDGWSGKLSANPGSLRVYLVGILGFVFKENRGCPDYLYRAELPVQRVANLQTRSVFDSRSALVYVELPKFMKTEAELVNQLDTWLYLLKHASKFSSVPDGLVGSVAATSLQAINYSNLTENEAWSYEMSLKHYRDLLNVVDTAYQQAFEEGFKQGELLAPRKVAMKMLKNGIAPDIISRSLGISVEELERLNQTIIQC